MEMSSTRMIDLSCIYLQETRKRTRLPSGQSLPGWLPEERGPFLHHTERHEQTDDWRVSREPAESIQPRGFAVSILVLVVLMYSIMCTITNSKEKCLSIRRLPLTAGRP